MQIRKRLDAPPAARAELLHVLMLPDFERADRIGEFWGNPKDADVGRAPDRLRGGPDAEGSARRHSAGFRLSQCRLIHPCGHASRGCQSSRSIPVGRLLTRLNPRALPPRRIFARIAVKLSGST